MRHLFLIPLALALAGCQATAPDRGFVGRVDGAAAPLAVIGADAGVEPLLTLPVEAGGLVRVRERHFRNGTRQEIVLAGASSGENVLEVSVRTSGGDEAPHGMLQIGKPSQRGIAIETAARFPGLRMMVVTRPMTNAFGPFGLAVGRRDNGERCVFAWQWIDDLRGETSGLGALMTGGTMAASVRLRMCRNNMTLDEIAGAMESLRRGDRSVIDRIARMDRRGIVDERAVAAAPAGSGGFVAPMATTLEAAVPGPPAAQPRIAAPAAAPPPPPAQRVRSAQARPPRSATKEPPEPPRARGLQQARQQAPQQALQQASPPVWGVAAPPAGPRYLAPVGGDVTSGTPAAPAPVRTGLSSALPSRAYMGPGSGVSY